MPDDLAVHIFCRPDGIEQCESMLFIVAAWHECKAVGWTQIPVRKRLNWRLSKLMIIIFPRVTIDTDNHLAGVINDFYVSE